MNAPKRKLPDTIATPQDLSALIYELRMYAHWATHVAVKKRLHLKHASEPPEITPTAKEVLKNWLNKRTISEDSLDKLVTALENFRRTAPLVTITLAALPTASQKQSLVSWCRENISPDTLVAFHCNSTMLGGLTLRYGSHLHDWSFRRALLANRAKVSEALHHV